MPPQTDILPSEEARLVDATMIALSALRGPISIAGLDHWNRIRGARALPLQSDLNPAEIARLLPNTVVIDVVGAPREFICRIVGESHKTAASLNGTGRSITALGEISEDAQRGIEALYNHVCDTKSPQGVRGNLSWAGRGFYQFESIHLPLSRTGDTVDRILVLSDYQLTSAVVSTSTAKASESR